MSNKLTIAILVVLLMLLVAMIALMLTDIYRGDQQPNAIDLATVQEMTTVACATNNPMRPGTQTPDPHPYLNCLIQNHIDVNPTEAPQ